MSWAWSQLHSAVIFPTSKSICQGQEVQMSSYLAKGSFKFFASINGKDYFIDTVNRSWTKARDEARANGMDLWSIENEIENLDVFNYIPQEFTRKNNTVFWIGLFQDRDADVNGSNSGWKWVDNRVLDNNAYKNWTSGEPDNKFQTIVDADFAGIGLNNDRPVWYDFPEIYPRGIQDMQ